MNKGILGNKNYVVKKFIQLLMWFRPVNEIIELVSGMPVPQLGHESS
jgi:hypothetical protein